MSNILRPGGTTIYFRDDGTNVFYSIDNASWSPVTFPCTVTNTTTSAGLVEISFTTGLTMRTTNDYFICGSSHIQFGSRSLAEDGSRTSITVDGVTNYPGLIENGTTVMFSQVPGQSNIYVYNIVVASNSSTLANGGGWLGQQYYGTAVFDNYIVNCHSDGSISDFGGGIVGSRAGGALVSQPAELTIRGCSSSGSIGSYAGGIAGNAAGAGVAPGAASGSILCEYCWNEGPSIGLESGGIFGDSPGINNGYAKALKCYSSGDISTDAGGIFGYNAAENSGEAIAEQCYSRGNIQANAGGIFGGAAGSSSGTTFAINCYSAGSITTTGTGIYGSAKVNGTETNCYAANGSWSSATANTRLTGTPSPIVGSVWVATTANQPYELTNMGYTPYTTEIINDASQLVQTYSQTIQQGQTTIAAVVADASGNNFAILRIQGGDSASYETISISSQRGSISTATNTAPGTYTLTVRSVGSYNITQFSLTVTETPSESVTCCEKPLYISRDVDYAMRNDLLAGNVLIANTSVRKTPISYSDLMNIKRAYAAKR